MEKEKGDSSNANPRTFRYRSLLGIDPSSCRYICIQVVATFITIPLHLWSVSRLICQRVVPWRTFFNVSPEAPRPQNATRQALDGLTQADN